MAGRKGIIVQIAETLAQREQAKQNKPIAPKRIDVTAERSAHNKIESAGMARKVVPVIFTLWKAQLLNDSDYSALFYYGEQASRAEDDECQSGPLSPDKILGGRAESHPIGGYIPASLICTPAILETARIERDLGELRHIARAIAVDNKSIAQWLVDKHGGRERYDGKGKFVAIVPIAEKRHRTLAMIELRMAARRISR